MGKPSKEIQPPEVRNAGLDGLRAIAALMVIGSHTVIPSYYGSFAVWLFFTLSGYLLGSQLLAKETWSGSVIPIYLARRVLRIYPLFAFVVIVTAVVGRESPFFGLDWTIGHLLFLRGEGYLWTVKQEMLFYILLPGVLFALISLRSRPMVTAALLFALAIVAMRYLTIDVASLRTTPTGVTDIKIAPFLLGVAAASFARSGVSIPRVFVPFAGSLLTLVVLAVLPMMFRDTLGTVEPFIDLGMAAIVLLTHRGLMGPLQTVLTFRPVQLLGVIGYGFYLWHWPVELVVSHFGVSNVTLKFFCVTAVTIPLAAVTYIAIERPFMRIRFQSAKSLSVSTAS